MLLLLLVASGCGEQSGSGQNSSNGEASRETTHEPTQSTEQGDPGEEGRDDTASDRGSREEKRESRQSSEQDQGAGGSEPGSRKPRSNLAERGEIYTVARVVDGDTVEVDRQISGEDNVRIIGVDTPETYGGEEPLGPEATDFAIRELEGERVALEFDAELIDPYGRPLAHLWSGPKELYGEEVVERGLAQVATFEPNVGYVSRFEAAQDRAQAAGLGIWGLPLAQQCELADRGNGIGEGTPGCASEEQQPAPAPDPAPSRPDSPQGGAEGGSGSAPPASEDDCPASHPIKGNEDSGIYHPLDGGSYEVTDPEICFASPSAAEVAGFRAAQN